jgi:hypothetical protein
MSAGPMLPDSAVRCRDRQARSPPVVARFPVNADCADHFVGLATDHRKRDDGNGDIIDRIAVVMRKDPLLLAEDRVTQRRRPGQLPGLRREAHDIIGGPKRRGGRRDPSRRLPELMWATAFQR